MNNKTFSGTAFGLGKLPFKSTALEECENLVDFDS